MKSRPNQTHGHIGNAELIGAVGGGGKLFCPALVLNLATFQKNLQTMAERCSTARINLRPHAKSHKCAEIARQQLRAGAIGVCCATAPEAACLGKLGIDNILLTTPLNHVRSIAAISELAKTVHMTVVIDSLAQIDLWEVALENAESSIQILVDMDMGMHRTGTKPADVTRLAAEVTQRRRMTYEGVQAYSGMVQHIQSFQERQRTYSLELVRLEHVLKDLNKSGLTPHTVSGGGTGTSAIDLSAGLFTESQAGSYALMDVEYNEIQMLREGRNPFKPAIFVRTYVAGLFDEHATVGAGFKAMSSDGPLPLAMEADLKYLFFGDEHGKLTGPGIERLRTGDVIDLMVPHCDPTVNLYDEIHVVDQDRLIEIWGVEARGYKWSSPQ